MSAALLSSPTDRSPAPDLRRLTGALLDEHADAGAHVAALVEGSDSAAWASAQPCVASFAAHCRQLAGDLLLVSGIGAVDRAPAAPSAPPIVWAREVGMSQRMVALAVDGISAAAEQEEVLPVLEDGLRRVRPVVAALGRIVTARG